MAGGDAARQRTSTQTEADAVTVSKPRRRLLIAAAVAGVLAIWSVVGVGVLSLLGGLPHLPMGP